MSLAIKFGKKVPIKVWSNNKPRGHQMKSFLKMALVVVCFSLLQQSPQEESLRKWVEHRGYVFNKDYSTLDPLGKIKSGNEFKSNIYFKIPGDGQQKGELPNLDSEKDRTIEIRGSAAVDDFIKHITDAKVSGNFKKVKKATTTFEKPFIEAVDYFYPDQPCNGASVEVVYKVINTGAMKISLEDSLGFNITSQFKVTSVGTLGTGATVEIKDNNILAGGNFYVGYLTKLLTCREIKRKEIKLQKGKELDDADLGLWLRLDGIKSSAKYPRNFEATVAMAASQFPPDSMSINKYPAPLEPVPGQIVDHPGDRIMRPVFNVKGNFVLNKRPHESYYYIEAKAITAKDTTLIIQYVEMDEKRK
jgi:hypothetical protein